MKKIYILLIILGAVCLMVFCPFSQRIPVPAREKSKSAVIREKEKIPENLMLVMQADLQFRQLRDPKTGQIPPGIRASELRYTSGLPSYSGGGG